MNRRLTAALVFLVTVVAMEAMSVAPVLPVIKAELGGLAWYGWAFAAFSLAQILAIPLTGRWLDRANPAAPLLGGLVAFVSGLVVASAAQSMPMLIGGRVLQGFGAGVIPAVAYVCVGRGFAEVARPRVFALMSTAWIVPSVIGPTAASFVTRHVGWRWVFGGLVPVTVIAGGLAIGVVRALGPSEGGEPEAGGTLAAVVLVAGTVGLVAGSQQASPAVAVPLALVGLVVAAIAFRWLTPSGTLRAARGLPAAVALRGLLTCAFFAADAFVPLTMQEVRGTGPEYAGFVFTVAAFTWTAGSWTQARLAERVGPRSFVRAGLALVGSGAALLLALAASRSVPTWTAVVAWAVGGLGIGLAYAPLSLVTLARAEPGREGFATSALQLSDALGVAVGTGLGGAVVATAERWGRGVDTGVVVVFGAATVLAGLAAVVAQRVPARVSEPLAGGAVDTAAVA